METFGRYSGIADITDAQRLALDLTNYKPPLLVETTDNGTWKWLGGTAWVQTHSGGAALVFPHGVAGIIESQIITINSAADVMTDPAAPVVGELIKVTPNSNDKQRAMIRWLSSDGSRVPYAEAVVATLNATEDNIALTRLTVADNGADGTNVAEYTASKVTQSLSAFSPIASWDLTQGDTVITDIYLGAIPTNGTGAAATYLEVLFW